jgi:molybdopterin/thiamine biosynthesis adenylyltransferase
VESYAKIKVKKMKIIIYPSFERQFNDLKAQERPYPLFGRIHDDFTVCHLIGVSPSKNTQPIGSLTLGSVYDEDPITIKAQEFPYLHIIVEEELSNLKVNIHKQYGEMESNVEVEVELLDPNRLFIRIDQKETPISVLSEKKVAIVGMGSGGSLLALYLAKSGVKNFIFIDDDFLETHNIIRHICDLTNLGRFKTKAVKDYIEARIPDVKVQTVERKFGLHTKAKFDFFMNLLHEVDLIAAVSGEHGVNYVINDFIHSNQLAIPIIYAGTFEGVKGGLMFKVDPRNNDFCYHCVYSTPEEYGSVQTQTIPITIELEQKISYDRTLEEQLAQPGLGIDVDNLTIFLSKFCLDVLLTGTDHGLYHFPYNFYMWFNRKITTPDKSVVKFDALELYYYEDLGKEQNCPFHGTQSVHRHDQEE